MSTTLHQIADGVWVAPQVSVMDMTELAAAGFCLLVNHRPDDEEGGQPSAADITNAAEAAGLRALHAPVHGLPDPAVVAVTREALKGMEPGDKVLMFCRSGMRSACAWAMAERQNGADPDALRAAALKAGYDLSRVPL